MTITTVVGARPQFIKAAVLSRLLAGSFQRRPQRLRYCIDPRDGSGIAPE